MYFGNVGVGDITLLVSLGEVYFFLAAACPYMGYGRVAEAVTAEFKFGDCCKRGGYG